MKKEKNGIHSPVCSAIVVAAGRGERMKSQVKKQFLPLLGRPVLSHTLEAIGRSSLVREILLVVSEEDLLTAKDLVLASPCDKVSKIIVGGKNRAESVSKGIGEVAPDCDIVLIHDGVRPCIEVSFIDQCIKNAAAYGASTLGVTPKCTIKQKDADGFITTTYDRDTLVEIQTPQCFQKEIIQKAYKNFDPTATDDCQLVEKTGVKIHITPGSYANLKLTTPEDLLLLGTLMEAKDA